MPLWAARSAHRSRAPIDKMAPARVERHLQVGIVDADQLGDDVRRHTEAFEIDSEVRELAAQARGEHLVRALAHG